MSDAHMEDEDRRDDESRGDEPEGGGAKKPSLFRRPLFWIILIVVVAAIVIGGLLYYLDARQYESTDDAYVDALIVRLAPTVGGTLKAVADLANRNVEDGRLLAVFQPSGPASQPPDAEDRKTVGLG